MLKRILVIGDIIRDVYSGYMFKKLCPDRPDVSAYVKTDSKEYLGGAANVAANLAALAGPENPSVYLLGALSERTWHLCRKITWLNTNACLLVDERTELVKERVSLEDGKINVRLDNASRYDSSTVDLLVHKLNVMLHNYHWDAIVVADYGSGFYRPELLSAMTCGRLIVDTKSKKLDALGHPHVLKLNEQEYSDIGMVRDRPPELFCDYCVVTGAEAGARLLMGEPAGERSYRTSALNIPLKKDPGKVVDVSGCGDTFLAALSYWLVHVSDDIVGAIDFANACAGDVVTKFGTAVVDYLKVGHLLPSDKRRKG